MLYGNYFLAAVIDSEDLTGKREFVRLDPDPALFTEAEEDAFEFVKSHLRKHGSIPTRATLLAHIPDVSLPTSVDEPPSYYYENMQQRYRHRVMRSFILEATDLLNAGEPDSALEKLFDATITLRAREERQHMIEYKEEAKDLIKEHFDKVMKGEGDGIPFGWETIDKDFSGMQPGDLITFIGRPGQGKTYLLLWAMLNAWKNNFSPLFVSMEMTTDLILQRMVALNTKTDATYVQFAGDKLSDGRKKKIYEILGAQKDDVALPPLWIVDGRLSATVDDIILHAVEKKPDVVFIDGAYLLKSQAKNAKNWERIYDVVEAIKRDLCGLQIPVVCTYQFNRSVTKKKAAEEMGLEDIAGGDAIGQLSSVVFGMFKEPSVETLVSKTIQILKGRHGETGSFNINWLFDEPDPMNFSEIPKETSAPLDYT